MIKIGNNISEFSTYSCQPKTKDELYKIIQERISKQGSECNLNDIDTSLITDMSWMFCERNFNGDISNWDTSNVTDMTGMFDNSSFNSDISNWDVSKVQNMKMMFNESSFNKPIGDWDVNNVIDMKGIFYKSKFNQDISNWNIRQDCVTMYAFFGCPIKEKFKPNFQ